MIDPLTDLLIMTGLLGATIGFVIHWLSTPQGEWWIQWRLFKRPAKILMTFYPGRLFKQEVVIPKTDSYRKKPGFFAKMFGAKEDDHTILPGWMRADAPIYRKLGSAAHFILNRKGEANAFDLDKVEYGMYKHTPESAGLYNQAAALAQKNEELDKQYNQLWADKKVEDAEAVRKQIEENTAAINDLVAQSNDARSFYRMTALPTTTATAIIDNEVVLQKSKEVKGFLGAIEQLMKTIKWVAIGGIILAGIAALTGVYLAFKIGGFKLGF